MHACVRTGSKTDMEKRLNEYHYGELQPDTLEAETWVQNFEAPGIAHLQSDQSDMQTPGPAKKRQRGEPTETRKQHGVH